MAVDVGELIPNDFRVKIVKPETEKFKHELKVEEGTVEFKNNQKVKFTTAFIASETHPATQDAYLNLFDKNLAVVCDGVGGGKSGEEVSQMAISLMKELYGSVNFFHTDTQAEQYLIEAITTINDRLYETFNKKYLSNAPRGQRVPISGTTLVASYFRFDEVKKTHVAILGSVGDSRIYKYDSSGLHSLTVVDNGVTEAYPESEWPAVQERLDNTVNPDVLNETDQKIFFSSEIPQALGRPIIHPHISKVEAKAGDYFLLTSDGVPGCLTSAEIELILNKEISDEEKTKEFVQRAKEIHWPARWRDDDLTVTLIHFLPKT
jgi:serine/threonine protein phosphatase PrpC